MSKAQIGVYGLGTMGSALALNLADNGVRVAVANRETEWLAPFMEEAGPLAPQITPTETLAEFVAAVDTPRTLLFMIPSGAPVDGMIAEIRPLLEEHGRLGRRRGRAAWAVHDGWRFRSQLAAAAPDG